MWEAPGVDSQEAMTPTPLLPPAVHLHRQSRQPQPPSQPPHWKTTGRYFYHSYSVYYFYDYYDGYDYSYYSYDDDDPLTSQPLHTSSYTHTDTHTHMHTPYTHTDTHNNRSPLNVCPSISLHCSQLSCDVHARLDNVPVASRNEVVNCACCWLLRSSAPSETAAAQVGMDSKLDISGRPIEHSRRGGAGSSKLSDPEMDQREGSTDNVDSDEDVDDSGASGSGGDGDHDGGERFRGRGQSDLGAGRTGDRSDNANLNDSDKPTPEVAISMPPTIDTSSQPLLAADATNRPRTFVLILQCGLCVHLTAVASCVVQLALRTASRTERTCRPLLPSSRPS